MFKAPLCLTFTVKASAAEKKKVLIVNTNSGGHAVIGFYFAKELLGSGHEVTTMTVGEQNSDKMKKPPFSRFSACSGLVQECWCEAVLFISSAGIYVPTDEPPHVEGDAVKASAGHVGVEKYIAEIFNSWAVFRPQYMIGSGNNKDCEEWFFDRIVRKRPVPIPGSGMQLTNIAHVRDLSSMLTLAVENAEAANGKIFNCVSDRAVTLDGMAKLCAQAAEPRSAKDILGWHATTNLPEDLKERFDEYVKIGRDKKPIQFDIDDKILEFLKVPVAV
ncbi:hypothetical protein GH714_024841 [Hevea brasiliensis]|uniref:NAD-dependent epimerase/dehydratase domain-containing protein n=1 Tax=Hevea brasiliensis TaxID=3981 RepID=A0A6A6NK07_HEVBR|nr:hypothetical protein GH714_024841 [Hevea brasiliensis]